MFKFRDLVHMGDQAGVPASLRATDTTKGMARGHSGGGRVTSEVPRMLYRDSKRRVIEWMAEHGNKVDTLEVISKDLARGTSSISRTLSRMADDGVLSREDGIYLLRKTKIDSPARRDYLTGVPAKPRLAQGVRSFDDTRAMILRYMRANGPVSTPEGMRALGVHLGYMHVTSVYAPLNRMVKSDDMVKTANGFALKGQKAINLDKNPMPVVPAPKPRTHAPAAQIISTDSSFKMEKPEVKPTDEYLRVDLLLWEYVKAHADLSKEVITGLINFSNWLKDHMK